jgi:diguanylate cyclase (GGDEF)-like protein
MKIKTKLNIIIIFSIILLAGVVSAGLLRQKHADRQFEQQALVGELNRAIFEQSRLREEYFLYREDRSKEQSLLIQQKIGGLLEMASGTFTGPEEKIYLSNMAGFHKNIGSLFDRLVGLDEDVTSNAASTQALQERIISQMLVNAHSMYSEGLKLLKETNIKTVHQNNLAKLYSNIVFGLLTMVIILLAVMIIRNITNPLTKLQEGTEIIAKGNLDYKTNIRTHDEIGRLSGAFDVMTEQLQSITVSRDELNREIAKQKQLEERLKAMSLTDELTGLYNRRGFFALAQQQLKVAERTKKDMLLFFADLDKMKQINDTLGHREGDKALIEIATILKEVFRESDIIGRMGGDEFAILAIDATDETGDVLIMRLHNILDGYNRPEGRNYQLSLSIGIAYYNPETASTLDELMSQADTLMYEEKRNKQH